jgi:hypothetical protein
MQQILVQMQGVNQLMQSMEERPSSRKRQINTQDDVGQVQKINAIKKQHQPQRWFYVSYSKHDVFQVWTG